MKKLDCHYYNNESDNQTNLYFRVDNLLTDEFQFHDSIEMIFFLKGEVIAHVNDEERQMHPEDIVFVDRYKSHCYKALSKQIEAIVLVLPREYTQKFFESYKNLVFETFLTDHESNKEINDFVRYWVNQKGRTTLFNYGAASMLMALMAKNLKMIRRDDEVNNSIAKLFLQYIHVHYLEDITLKTIAGEFGYTIEHCSKILKNTIGTNFRDYLNSLRMRKAKEMLADRSLNLSKQEILYQCGYRSPATFYRALKDFENKNK